MNINEILSFSRKIIHIFSCLCTIFSLMFMGSPSQWRIFHGHQSPADRIPHR